METSIFLDEEILTRVGKIQERNSKGKIIFSLNITYLQMFEVFNSKALLNEEMTLIFI